jgi:hypothetical protein
MKRIAAAAVLAFCFLLATAGAAVGESWTGWITDESCGAKGANAGHKACATKCMGSGAKLVFYDGAGKKLYTIDRQDVAKENLGHEVVVTGTLEGDAIKVESIARK